MGTLLAPPNRVSSRAGGSMPDLAYVLATVAFFALAYAYAVACERL
jgi:hypothetical protein